MSTEIGRNTIAAPAETFSRPLLPKEGQNDRNRELFFRIIFRKYNTVVEHSERPQRPQGRQLTFELSQPLAVRCLTLASFKCLTLPEL